MSKAVKRIYLTASLIVLVIVVVLTAPPIVDAWNVYQLVGVVPTTEIIVLVLSAVVAAVLIVSVVIENRVDEKEAAKRERGESID